MEREAYQNAALAGPANRNYTWGTSSSHGTVQDRGTDFGVWRRYPKGIRVNTAGSALLVSPDGGTSLFVVVAGETLLFRWSAIARNNAIGTTNIDNYVIIWD